MAKRETEPSALDPTVPPVFQESMAGALIDSARISVMAAMSMLPPLPAIVLPGDENDPPSVAECLEQAMNWLNAARGISIEQAEAPPTSLHVVTAGGGGGR